MDKESLLRWLAEEKWELAAGVAEDELARDLALSDRAVAHFAACISYSHLGRFAPALSHGHSAVAAGLEVQAFDLVGKSLLELAYIQQRMDRHDEAIATLDTFGRYLSYYTEAVAKKSVVASLNRGIALRSVGEYEKALGEFLQSMQKAHEQGEVKTREYCRAQATWVALELGNTDLAQDLIDQGTQYQKRFPEHAEARVWQLHDQAWLTRLQGNPQKSCALAFEAACAAGDNLEMLAYALRALFLAALALGEPEAAFKVGLLSKHLAEAADNSTLVTLLQDGLSQLVLQHRTIIEGIGKEATETRRA